MKKFFVLLFTLCLMAFMLTACTDNTTPKQEEALPSEVVVAEQNILLSCKAHTIYIGQN